jgi:hypothetical protein
VLLDTYKLQATAEGYEPSSIYTLEATEEITYTLDFLLLKTVPLIKFIDTDFSTGTLDPYTPMYMGGTFDFFTPETDPLGTGEYGVIFKGGRIFGRYEFKEGLGFIRATQHVAFADPAALNGFLVIETKAMAGTGNSLIHLDVYNNQWRTIYFSDGYMHYGEYPKIAPPEPNRKYRVTVELKMGPSNGEARLYIDDVLVWERTNLNNVQYGPAIERIDIGLPSYGEGSVVYFYDSLVEGTTQPIHTLSGYVRDALGNPLENAVIAVGIGEIDKGVIHVPIAAAYTDSTGYYSLQLAAGTYIVEAFKGPGKLDTWLRDEAGRVLDYCEKVKQLLELYSDLTLDFSLNLTLAPEPPPMVTRDFYWDERSVWVFPYYWGGYSLRDGTATPKPEVTECLDELKAQIPNINTIDVRLSLAPHPTVLDMPIISEAGHPATMEDIEAITKAAHERGLKVHLGIVPYGGIEVTDPATWFKNYLNLLLNPTPEQRETGQTEGIIEMCKRIGIEEFTLGWEFWFNRKEFEEGEWNNYWSDVVDKIRAAGYTGKLAFHFQYINDPNGYWGPPVDKFRRLNTWVKKLDFIAISDFHPHTFYPNNVDVPYYEALRTWYQHPDLMEGYGTIPICKMIWDTFHIPIVVNYGYDLHWASPLTYGIPSMGTDEHMQAMLYKVSFEALAGKEWCCGVDLEHFDYPYFPRVTAAGIRGEYSTQIINAGLASHSVQIPPGKGALEVHAFADTKEVAATVEVVGVETKTTPFVTYLSPGNYTLNAKYDTQTQTRTTTIVEGQVTREDFHFVAPTPKPPVRVGISTLWGFPFCSRMPNVPPCPLILEWAKRQGYISEGAM